MPLNITKLRALALAQTFFQPATLKETLNRLQFVQADPIRAPARAQDLILRHRVNNYKVNDLGKNIASLGLEEDYLYAYGFLTKNLSDLLLPKKVGRLSKFDKIVLDAVDKLKLANSKDLEKVLGRESVKNWWGGSSRAAKHSLDILNYYGLVRVLRRENGNKIYEVRKQYANPKTQSERKKEIILSIVNILNPVTEKKLTEALHFTKRLLGDTKKEFNKLVKDGVLTREKIDGVTYILEPYKKFEAGKPNVAFLAPFDPMVWDRNRFEHLWGWQYRFEAYTPKHKRIRGYYAMPLLWNEDIIGWANIKVVNKKLDIELGFAKGRPKSKVFEKELAKEVEKMKIFLGL
ncbi:hypothetical protein A2803_05870 [Candidatus Woesebacteria bacterium RIFCSPHIGHO2_01_FULL_44_21]|uniref:Cytoplasmic protein n=1 Tax=Candidatus Woesebacteria bacterium RIFCSPHIGHO2_01_FULL_44_21 TaxID=1802503 RepID=A0A1F7YZQ0_9BACT|nr:MAG: hypothetical protein A2803_05870 [Candidatus Woesebacteria bacterium RIFCSPHIGHO2_01_FULL_44_21]OGM71089.1 MAG: hypothetical protein A2897_02555 [Candidatus Woesebacteria bacterium RIFCSPLOWO2_01_FULL_44_24b]